MGNETIIKIKKRVNPYTMIDKSIFLDTRISWKAKGLMGYFLSRPDDWKINIKDLYKQSTDGYDSVKSGLNDLKKHGYLELKPIREKGKIVSWEYIVYEVPMQPDDEYNGPSPPQEDFPLVANPPEEKPIKGNPSKANPPKGNPSHTNNEVNNNYNTNKDDYKEFDLTDRNNIILKRYEFMIAKSQLNLFEDHIAHTVEEALKSLYFDEEFSNKNLNIPLELVRSSLDKINPPIIECAVTRMKKAAASGIAIKSTKHYLMTCIFNSITEYIADQLANPLQAKQEVYKQKKSIFDLVRGTDFEKPILRLSQSFSEIIFNTFFKEKVTNITINGQTLNLIVNSEFVANTLSAKHMDKIKECFEDIGVHDVIISTENCELN